MATNIKIDLMNNLCNFLNSREFETGLSNKNTFGKFVHVGQFQIDRYMIETKMTSCASRHDLIVLILEHCKLIELLKKYNVPSVKFYAHRDYATEAIIFNVLCYLSKEEEFIFRLSDGSAA